MTWQEEKYERGVNYKNRNDNEKSGNGNDRENEMRHLPGRHEMAAIVLNINPGLEPCLTT